MNKIQAFSPEENDVIKNISSIFAETGKDIYALFISQKKDIEALAGIVSRTPSLKSRQRHGFFKRDIETMADVLSSSGTENPLIIPSRATLGKCFGTAKINFFYFILKSAVSCCKDEELIESIRRCCEKLVFSLMAEKAYEVIIGSSLTDKKTKKTAADELAYLWEYRIVRNLDSFSPPLMALWKQRCSVTPILGTLMGTIEVLKLSMNLSNIWYDFLSELKNKTEAAQALEEFIFGLSYEEISQLRKKMKELDIQAVNKEKAAELLNKEKKEIFFTAEDARQIYSFFHMRLENCFKRKVSKSPGPLQTIEELFLIFIINSQNGFFSNLYSKLKSGGEK